jgi:hypothetical protein
VAAQDLFRRIVAEYSGAATIAGVVEEREMAMQGRTCRAGRLRSLPDNRLYPMFQELGPGEAGCDLQEPSVATACDAVRRDIAAGCDLAVLSKFGKLESTGHGLFGAFAAAIEAGVPVLTLIPPHHAPAWSARLGVGTVPVPAEIGAIRDWLGSLGVPP